MSVEDLPQVEVRSVGELHDWLAGHRGTSGSVWLVTYKQSHSDYLPFGEVVEELLCWGWVDSAVRRVDEARMKHLISPRKETSAWSGINKGIVERMRAAGRMEPSGEAKVAAARANGMWEFLDDVERVVVPDDLAEALGSHRDTWEGWSRSVRRAWLEQIKLAKVEATRARRIAKCADAVSKNLKNGGLR